MDVKAGVRRSAEEVYGTQAASVMGDGGDWYACGRRHTTTREVSP
jgi:hypothetical protein